MSNPITPGTFIDEIGQRSGAGGGIVVDAGARDFVIVRDDGSYGQLLASSERVEWNQSAKEPRPDLVAVFEAAALKHRGAAPAANATRPPTSSPAAAPRRDASRDGGRER